MRALRAAFDVLGGQPRGLELVCANRIPHGRGLGSSAAAIVAGLVAGRALVAGGADRLDDDALLALATELEGHPDNVAACLLGGLTLAWTDGRRRARGPRSSPRPDLRAGRLRARAPSSPPRRRAGCCPAAVPHADAAHAAGRAALLVAALTGDPSCCSPRPRTGCTRGTGRRRCRRPLALVAALRAAGRRRRGLRRRPDRAGAGRPGDADAVDALAAGLAGAAAGPSTAAGASVVAALTRERSARSSAGRERLQAPVVLRSCPHQKPLTWPVPRHDFRSPRAARRSTTVAPHRSPSRPGRDPGTGGASGGRVGHPACGTW